LFILLATAVPASAQWNTGTAGQMNTPNFVAIGPAADGSGIGPHFDTGLRLSYPKGSTSFPCAAFPTSPSKCFHLAFGTPDAQWWGFKLDSNFDLHLIRNSNGGWKEGLIFSRSGDVLVNGWARPLRLDGQWSGGFGVEFRDLVNGISLDMQGNSTIHVSNLEVGRNNTPVINGPTTSPLYLNQDVPDSNVVIGKTTYTNMGLRVESTGKSNFRGSVGIGTETPDSQYKLDVAGNANFSGTVTGGNIQAKYQDVAEWVPSAAHLPAATLVVLDPARSNHVIASTRAYDTTVAGVVSAQPGISLGEPGAAKALVATTGRVRVRVDATKQPISIGDLLVTSDKPGVAMKSIPLDIQGIALHRPGTVVGKALEPLTGGEGEILVLLSLQ